MAWILSLTENIARKITIQNFNMKCTGQKGTTEGSCVWHPGAMLEIHPFSLMALATIKPGNARTWPYYFTDEETEAQKDWLICPSVPVLKYRVWAPPILGTRRDQDSDAPQVQARAGLAGCASTGDRPLLASYWAQHPRSPPGGLAELLQGAEKRRSLCGGGSGVGQSPSGEMLNN